MVLDRFSNIKLVKGEKNSFNNRRQFTHPIFT